MEFTFENFGKAGSGVMRIRDLTIICGPNNSGKTYLNYAVHSILRDLKNIFDYGMDYENLIEQIMELNTSTEVHLDLSQTLFAIVSAKADGLSNVGANMHKYFGVSKDNFVDTKITLNLDKIDINKKISITGEFIVDLIQYHYEFMDGKCLIHLYKTGDDSNNGSPVLNNKKNVLFLLDKIRELIFRVHFSDIVPFPFAITAERTGAALFYKAYDTKNSSLLNSETSEIEKEKTKLAQPIVLNINDMRNYEDIKDRESFVVRENHSPVLELLSELLDFGSYILREETLYFKPSENLEKKEPVVPIHATSSSIKSFFLLNVFINNVAEKNRMLVIDEPELNLYIDKQVMFAKLVARLVNAGIKVLVTTHSDYFIREINNLITLNSLSEDDKKEIMEEFDFLEGDILDHSKVSAYKTDLKADIQELKVNSMGIDPSDWNKSINFENRKFDKIYFSSRENDG